MSAIGPGDWVECVNVNGCKTDRLQLGAVYRVEAVGIVPHDQGYQHPGAPWVRLAEFVPTPGTFGFHADRFRPVYRPKSDLIDTLKAPAPDAVRELIAAD